MNGSKATTPEDYLAGLPEERRGVVSALRDVVLEHLPEGYREAMTWGMLTYEIPLERCPNTYNRQPLMCAALAAQKNHYAIYLTAPYTVPEEEARIREGFARAGKKLDMGKSCIRFKKLDDLAMGVITESIARTPPDAFIAHYEAVRRK